jgi:hypothetical protein
VKVEGFAKRSLANADVNTAAPILLDDESMENNLKKLNEGSAIKQVSTANCSVHTIKKIEMRLY